MKLGRILLAGAALALCGASAAQAGTKIMATPPIPNNIPVNHTMFCDLMNFNTTPKDVTIEIMDLNGVIANGPFGPITLGPSQGIAFSNNSGTGAWCRFTVDGSTKKYRGIAIYDNGTNYTVSVPAY